MSPAATSRLDDARGASPAIRVLVIEDDRGDAVLVGELLAESEFAIEAVLANSLEDALGLVADEVGCVLLDLGLPDAQGLDALGRLLSAAPDVPVIVVTGLSDRDLALEAVARGAQDYLAKQEIDTPMLSRAIRYAVERQRADETARKLLANELIASERARLERGLLPRPLLTDAAMRVAMRYRPGGGELLLGGDFFDTVELADGTIRTLVGDVAGHGPSEAAIGVALRIAWRTLVLSGAPEDDVLPSMQRILEAERNARQFATVCDATIMPSRRELRLRVAGHLAPLLLEPEVTELQLHRGALPLGLGPEMHWPVHHFELPERWTLLFYTDGLVEGRRRAARSERWGVEGLMEAVRRVEWRQSRLGELADALIEAAESENGGPVADDIALLLLATEP